MAAQCLSSAIAANIAKLPELVRAVQLPKRHLAEERLVIFRSMNELEGRHLG
jgi:hypothetical protein